MTLIILNILVWLGPLFLSLRKGTVHTLHPQFMMPIFIIYFILNSYIQDQTNWMDEGSRGIIVGVVKLLPGLDPESFSFDKALVICAFSGFFFHLGSSIFNTPIYNSIGEYIQLDKKNIIKRNKNLVTISAIIISSVLWLPNYFMPNAGHGTFWTFPLALSVCFIPVAMLKVSKISFFFTLTAAFLIGNYILSSKAAFGFIVIPFILYFLFFHFNFLKLFFKKSYFKKFIIFISLFSVFISALFVGNQYGNLDTRKLFRRDYVFEVFAILVESKKLGLIEHEKSWIKNELFQAFPSVLYKKKTTGEHINPGKRVAKELFPQTAMERPNTYWAKHLLFPGYYDFGTWGAILTAFFSGTLISFLWRLTKLKVIKYNAKWPIFVYLPIPSFGIYYISAGAFAYGIINTVIASFVLYLIFISSRLRLVN